MAEETPPGRDPAIARLWGLTAVRLAGVALMLAAIWQASEGRALAGAALALPGFLLVVLVPRLLLRRWLGPRAGRTPRP